MVKHDGPVGRLLEALGRHPWRPAHIHFLVTAPLHKQLVTQAYVGGGPYLDDDAISGVKDELIRTIEGGRLRFDIVLARTFKITVNGVSKAVSLHEVIADLLRDGDRVAIEGTN